MFENYSVIYRKTLRIKTLNFIKAYGGVSYGKLLPIKASLLNMLNLLYISTAGDGEIYTLSDSLSKVNLL
jgi:hypothetical protein